MKLFTWLLTTFVLATSVPTHAEITWTGDVDPEDPTTWTSSTNGYVGFTADGTLTVDGGSQLLSIFGNLGRAPGVTGTVVVTGNGSQWNNSKHLHVGDFGSGTLTVENGGLVTARTLYASLDDLYGDGTIIASAGAVLDADLVFDSSYGTTAYTTFGSGGTLTVTADGGVLGVGYKGAGTLSIAEGVQIQSGYGYLGYHRGSHGTATVTGVDSQWNNSFSLYVGYNGNGTLSITDGGVVSDNYGYLGHGGVGATSIATVAGTGSHWDNWRHLYIGYHGNGMLLIEAGGLVSCYSSYVGTQFDSEGISQVTVTGADSRWDNRSSLYLGLNGDSILQVDSGGQVTSMFAHLGIQYYYRDSRLGKGTATVTGIGSQWNNSGYMELGYLGAGTLTITEGGLVSVGQYLNIDRRDSGNSYINMATGGMLALRGEADDSLTDFLDLIQGTDAINYWDTALADWAPLTNATYGDDYTLQYLTSGDLAGYTLLTVGTVSVPEPSTLAYLLLLTGFSVTIKRVASHRGI